MRESRRHCKDCQALGKTSRGINLSRLDRTKVYRLAYVPARRRWEVVGPDSVIGADRTDGRSAVGRAGLAAEGACAVQPDRTDGANGGRHAAPDADPGTGVTVGGSS